MDIYEFMARMLYFLPAPHMKMIRYYGLYSNAHRGKERKRERSTSVMPVLAPPPAKKTSPGWRELVGKVSEVDPLTCPVCGAHMKVIAFITNYAVIDKIIHHLGLTFTAKRPPPAAQQEELY